MITARNVLQYWPLCHDYSYDMIKVVCMPRDQPLLKLAFVPWMMTMTPAMHTGDVDNDDDDDAKLSFVPTDNRL
jgi:hypothetical protein